MHKVILKNTIFVFTVLSAVSCMRQFAEAAMPEQPQEKESSIPYFAITKGMLDSEDSLARIVFRQSDPDMRMLNQILCIDGQYRLAISAEEAEIIGIPADVYEKYQLYVDSLNAPNND